MKLFKHGFIFIPHGFEKKDFAVEGNCIRIVTDNESETFYDSVTDCSNCYIVPGFVDVHVHFREPGFFYKETIETGSYAAAKGGYTTVCTMPNLKPAPSSLDTLNEQLRLIEKNACIHVLPFGTITQDQSGHGELSDMEAMADYVAGFSDDGKGVQEGDLMKKAMLKAKALNKPIVAHCEDESYLHGGYIHEGEYAKKHQHVGICSESEWKQVERDLQLVKETGVAYHICHVSTKESVELIRQAKKEGINVTCETGPHYLILCDEDLQESGDFKMNPPLRSKEDRKALIEGVLDGTIDMIATDHAPHSFEEKNKGLKDSLFGIVGLETSFQLMNTYFVQKNLMSLEQLMKLMAINPRSRFHLPQIYIEDGAIADFTIINLDEEHTIDRNTFVSKGKATPFDGMKVYGEVKQTFVDGQCVYKK